jgi:hypothetical protein
MRIRSGQLSFEIAESAKHSFCTNGNLSRRTPTRDLHVVFIVPYTILLQNYAGNRRQSYSVMKKPLFGTLAKARFSTESIKGLILVAVRHTIGQLSRLWLYLGQYMSNEHNVLHGTWVTS